LTRIRRRNGSANSSRLRHVQDRCRFRERALVHYGDQALQCPHRNHSAILSTPRDLGDHMIPADSDGVTSQNMNERAARPCSRAARVTRQSSECHAGELALSRAHRVWWKLVEGRSLSTAGVPYRARSLW
jgi:hypothetical protein